MKVVLIEKVDSKFYDNFQRQWAKKPGEDWIGTGLAAEPFLATQKGFGVESTKNQNTCIQ